MKILIILCFIAYSFTKDACFVSDKNETSIELIRTKIPDNILYFENELMINNNETDIIECEDYKLYSNNTTVYYLIRNMTTVEKLNITSETISFLKTISSNTTFCSFPSTATFGYLCQLYNVTTKLPQMESINITNDDVLLNYTHYLTNNSTSTNNMTISELFSITSLGLNYFSSTYNKSITSNWRSIYNNAGSTKQNINKVYSRFYHHITKPFVFLHKTLKNKNLRSYSLKKMDKISISLNTFVYRYKNLIEHMKSVVFTNNPLKSYNDHISAHGMNYILYPKKKVVKNWKNFADLDNTFIVNNPVDVVNLIGSGVSALFYINNEYNQSGCLGDGGLKLPEFGPVCRVPTFKNTFWNSILPEGFDVWDPQCINYLLPNNYILAIGNTLTFFVREINRWLAVHEYPIIKWFRYDIDGKTNLPPNMVPCIVLLSPIQLTFLTISVSIPLLILSLCTNAVQKAGMIILKEEDKYIDLPDLRKSIPTPNKVISATFDPIEGFINNAPGQIQNYGNEVKTKFDSKRRKYLNK